MTPDAQFLQHIGEPHTWYYVCPCCGTLVFDHDSGTTPATWAAEVVCTGCGWRLPDDADDEPEAVTP